MSEYIKKFRLPPLSKKQLESGVRYALEHDEQKDWLGQVLEVGDFVIYTGSYAGQFYMAKVVGMYTRINTDGSRSNNTSLAVQKKDWQGNIKIKRQGVASKDLIKVTREQYKEKVTEALETS